MPEEAGPLPDALSAIEDAPCGLLQTDPEGVILWANRTFCRWTKFELAQLRARRLQDMLTMGGRIFHQTHWAPLLQMQGSVSEVKLEIVASDGRALPVMMNAQLRQRGAQRVQEVALFVANDRDKYEQELLRSRRKLEETLAEAQRLRDEAKDQALFAQQMIGIVSHDLRNPLSVIHMSSQLLTRLGASAQQEPVIARMARSAERANRLIADLLDFTRARLGGGIAVSPRPVRLHAFVRDAVDELKLAFAQRELRHVAEGPEVECPADADRLAQVLGNLVANAMSYGAADRPVTVTSKAGANACWLSVHNFGSPIPEELAATIFLPMARGEPAGSEGRSIGLGLYIVSEITKAHGGTVRVESSRESGTEFTVTLPCGAAAATAA